MDKPWSAEAADDPFIRPQWPAPTNVHALQTTRRGGVSSGSYAGLNLGTHVGDDAATVAANRRWLRGYLPAEPAWLEQVHGVAVAAGERAVQAVPPCTADAAVTRQAQVVCAVMTADCLPVLLCTRDGAAVGAAHAGWRGLQAGVLEAAVAGLQAPGREVLAWLGPAIGPSAFEVGDEVRAAFVSVAAEAASAFVPHRPGKWWCDLYALARQRLAAVGVTAVYGGDCCTYTDEARFFSYRRNQLTGRMASLIWREAH